MVEAIETHHIRYEPELTVEIQRREHQKLHGKLPKDSKLSKKMREYDKVNRLIISQKTWLIAFEKDFGTKPDIGLKNSSKLKRELNDGVYRLIKDDLNKVSHIKGLGTITLGGILGYAHPNRFQSRWKFLCYCGFTQTSEITKKYNRMVKTKVYQATQNLLMNKDKKYYALYKKFRSDGLNH